MTELPTLKLKENKKYTAAFRLKRKALEKLDFLLVLIEAIEINGVNSLLITSKNIGLEGEFSNSVELWKTRAHNPLRKASRRGKLPEVNINSLIVLISKTADRLYPLLRQLLSQKEPADISQKRWELLSLRFNELICERMNLKRAVVQKMILKENTSDFVRYLVFLLALSSGPEGVNRLKIYINDLEV